MNFCRECSWSPLPFIVVLFVAGVSAFLTWLTLAYAEFGVVERIVGSGGVFLAVSGTLLHYVLSCMKRHCRHGSQPGHQHGV